MAAGPAWEREIRFDVATAGLDDQVAALEHVVRQYPGELDADHVGIRGWSFGGYFAALAVLRRPDVFAAAIAGAPVTDWRWYDTVATERYLGLPAEHPEAYERSSLFPLAAGLTRPLLFVHGLADDNVHPRHSLLLARALLAAGRGARGAAPARRHPHGLAAGGHRAAARRARALLPPLAVPIDEQKGGGP